MPWTVSNPPPPAKNWTQPEKAKCVRAANAVLRDGGTDQEAIYACIHAAGRSRRKQDDSDKYDALGMEYAEKFIRYLEMYFAGTITLDAFHVHMQDNLRDLYILMAQLGLDDGQRDYSELTDSDLVWINERLSAVEEMYLDQFIEDLSDQTSSPERFLWRAGLYGFPRACYVNFTLPPEISELMPVLPGDDCLGGSNCHCALEVEEDETNIFVFWVLDPTSRNCPVCIAHALESPFTFRR